MSGHASVRRILKAAGLLLTIAAALLVGVGAIWEQVERQRAIRDFPVAGRLVDNDDLRGAWPYRRGALVPVASVSAFGQTGHRADIAE